MKQKVKMEIADRTTFLRHEQVKYLSAIIVLL